MKRELRQQLERLGQERQRLEAVLARQPAWSALNELLRREAPADDYGRYAIARDRARLEGELSGNPVYDAYRSVAAAIQVIEGLLGATPPPEAPSTEEVSAVPAAASVSAEADPPPEIAHNETANARAPVAAAVASEVELLTLGGGHGGRVVTRAATIHHGPPGSSHSAAPLSARADAPPDPLTRIRRIDKGLAAALVARGVRHFAQIAAFGPADVRALSAALGLGRRISQENWIEQAALLAMKAGSETSVGRPASAGVSNVRSTEQRAAHSSTASETPANLDQIGADTGRAASDLAVAAVAAAAVAAAHANRRGAVPLVHATLNIPARKLERHASSMQSLPLAEAAALTSRSDEDRSQNSGTRQPDLARLVHDIARRIGASANAPALESTPTVANAPELANAPSVEPPPPVPSIVDAPSGPLAGSEDVRVVVPPGPEPPPLSPPVAQAVPSPEPVAATPDDLRLIAGIDDTIADRLSVAGIARFAAIAAWDAPTVTRISAMLGLGSGIARQGWIEQAAMLARGTMTAHAERVRRGEFGARVARPDAPVLRDPAFAAWLAARTSSFAAQLPSVVDEAEPSPAPSSALMLEPCEGHAPEVSEADVMSDIGAGALLGEPDAECAANLAAASADLGGEADDDTSDDDIDASISEIVAAATTGDTTVEDASAAEAAQDQEALPPPKAAGAAIGQADAIAFAEDPAQAAWHQIAAHATEWPPVTFDEPPRGAPAAGAADDVHTTDYDAVPPLHERPVARQLSIADRITAIEREAAHLPLSPRAALARFRDPSRDQTARPASAAAPSRRRSLDESAHAEAELSGYGEADVRIVMREAHAAGLESPSEVTRRNAADAEDADPIEYAAYRGMAEEASVEIVRAPTPADEPGDAPAASVSGQSAPSAAPRNPQESGTVRRFLKALTGE